MVYLFLKCVCVCVITSLYIYIDRDNESAPLKCSRLDLTAPFGEPDPARGVLFTASG